MTETSEIPPIHVDTLVKAVTGPEADKVKEYQVGQAVREAITATTKTVEDPKLAAGAVGEQIESRTPKQPSAEPPLPKAEPVPAAPPQRWSAASNRQALLRTRVSRLRTG
ncbi:hypothetical protein A2160_04105 [Candidatus Beckwithbacteria bacterium RBG_13_42_9]|uniref:Uncharacterized protein n=1 Tax=Candidatus Beckwithbacteria bacterium RBG_13_42_9 TaxID=1797457 RepID=A0A1F5E6J4_9BACT|nr:MAG: hypothetical protein A2160_04105 [Candidatus Beckwithbacteria bacterium RBG_13_42_9]